MSILTYPDGIVKADGLAKQTRAPHRVLVLQARRGLANTT